MRNPERKVKKAVSFWDNELSLGMANFLEAADDGDERAAAIEAAKLAQVSCFFTAYFRAVAEELCDKRTAELCNKATEKVRERIGKVIQDAADEAADTERNPMH